jgi:hypothetical protein
MSLLSTISGKGIVCRGKYKLSCNYLALRDIIRRIRQAENDVRNPTIEAYGYDNRAFEEQE